MANIPNVPNMPNIPNVPAVAGLDNQVSHIEILRMQLCGSLSAVANAMREAANVADQYSQLVRDSPYHPGTSNFLPPNGQYLQMAPAPSPLPAAPTGGKRKHAEDGEDGKKRRKTKPKDPLAPKRPASSYLLFQNDVRGDLKAKNPHLPNNELLHLISKAWNDMPRVQKDQYEERQKMAKDQYLIDKAAYEHRTVAAVPGAASPAVLPDATVQPAAVSPAAVSPAAVSPVAPTSAVSSDDEESTADPSEVEDSEDSDEEVLTVKKSKHRSSKTPVKADKEKKSKKSKA